MKRALILAMLLWFGTAPASVPNVYEHLNALFAVSSVPPIARVLGWYAGRCASATHPDQRVPGLLTTYLSNGQPKSVFWFEPGKPQDYFDHLTPELEKEITEGLHQWDPQTPPFIREPAYWHAVHLSPQHRDETRTRAVLNVITVQALHDNVQTWACGFDRKVKEYK